MPRRCRLWLALLFCLLHPNLVASSGWSPEASSKVRHITEVDADESDSESPFDENQGMEGSRDGQGMEAARDVAPGEALKDSSATADAETALPCKTRVCLAERPKLAAFCREHSSDSSRDFYLWRSVWETAWDEDEQAKFISLCFILAALASVVVHAWQTKEATQFGQGLKQAWARLEIRGLLEERGYANATKVPTDDDSMNTVGPKPDYPADKRIVEIFEESLVERRHQVALTALPKEQGEQVIELTYRELSLLVIETANAASALVPGEGMAILLLQRSIAQVVAIYGLLKAGIGCVPVDLDAPFQRKEVVTRDSDASIIVSTPEEAALDLARVFSLPLLQLPLTGKLGDLTVFQPATGGKAELAADLPATTCTAKPKASDLAILLYTSGTTGVPKGIKYDHKHLLHGTWFFADQCQMSTSSVALLKSPIIWAVVEWELFPAILRGGRLVIGTPTAHKNPKFLVQVIKQQGVDVLMITPQVLELVLDIHEAQGSRHLQSLQHIVAVGEPLPCLLANRVVQAKGMGARLHNFYGASESSCTIFTIPDRGLDVNVYPRNVPAGIPQPHAAVYVMRLELYSAGESLNQATGKVSDSSSQARAVLVPVKAGEPGEICFGGVLAAGYWKQPQLTKEKWVDTPQGTLYRTGDLGRWRHGVLEVIGRVDRQVKVRGVRVEPEEVEAVLKRFGFQASEVVSGLKTLVGEAPAESKSLLSSVAVVASKDPVVELVAFVCQRNEADSVSVEALRAHCLAHLPAAYVPKFFVVQTTGFPLLPNGKTDISALQKMATTLVQRDQHVVVDSLGQMKTISSMAVSENSVIQRCYTYWMIGVVLDHYCQCAMEDDPALAKYCAAMLHPSMKHWVEIVVRSIGNDQSMFGFILLGAYKESRSDEDAAGEGCRPRCQLGVEDLYMLLVNMAMVMPLPQIMNMLFGDWAWSCYRSRPEDGLWSTEYMRKNFAMAAHRWYLLMILEARGYMAICEKIGMSPLFQAIVVSLPCMLPGELFDNKDYALDICDGGWMWEPLEFLINWAWLKYPGEARCALFYRWMHWYTALYVWCYHYGRPISRWFLQKHTISPTRAIVAGSASILIGILMAMFHYPNTLLEYGYGLHWFWLEVSANIVQPILLAYAMAYFPFNMSWWGNTTLGTYVFHYYFMGRAMHWVSEIAVQTAWDETGLSTLFLLLSMVFVVNTVLGPLGHQLLLLPRAAIIRLATACSWCLMRRRELSRRISSKSLPL